MDKFLEEYRFTVIPPCKKIQHVSINILFLCIKELLKVIFGLDITFDKVDQVGGEALAHVNSRVTLASLALQLSYFLQDAKNLPS